MANHGNVINWEEALQQCGDDEEFLHELLADFKSELETQLTSIAATIQVSYRAVSVTVRAEFCLGRYLLPRTFIQGNIAVSSEKGAMNYLWIDRLRYSSVCLLFFRFYYHC